ncbi:MAG: cytochrome c oxidase subunit, partial [Verrucomicrobiota bacterium]
MDASSGLATHADHPPSPGSGAAGDHHDSGHDHHELPFWRKYLISTDHKVIGIQYGISGLIFLFFGFSLMMLMRWQLAYPGQEIPVIGNLLGRMFGPGAVENGVMKAEFYNSLGAMHGTIMIFLGIVPIAF